jgi:hypothetical protein
MLPNFSLISSHPKLRIQGSRSFGRAGGERKSGGHAASLGVSAQDVDDPDHSKDRANGSTNHEQSPCQACGHVPHERRTRDRTEHNNRQEQAAEQGVRDLNGVRVTIFLATSSLACRHGGIVTWESRFTNLRGAPSCCRVRSPCWCFSPGDCVCTRTGSGTGIEERYEATRAQDLVPSVSLDVAVGLLGEE